MSDLVNDYFNAANDHPIIGEKEPNKLYSNRHGNPRITPVYSQGISLSSGRTQQEFTAAVTDTLAQNSTHIPQTFLDEKKEALVLRFKLRTISIR